MNPIKECFAAVALMLVALVESLSRAHSNSSRALNRINYAAPSHCTEYWQYGNHFVEEHCGLALALLQETDVAVYANTRIEFLAPNTSPTHTTSVSLSTPRKYSYDTCTIAIMLIDTIFPDGDVPIDLLPRDHWSREITTFASLESAAKQVLKTCVHLKHNFGLTIDGEIEHAVGLFIWETGGWLDEKFQAAVDVRLKNATGFGAGTLTLGDDATQ